MTDAWIVFFVGLFAAAAGGGLGTFGIIWLSEHGYLSGKKRTR